MGVFTHESEYKSIIAPSKLFKAFVLDGDKLFPKIAPQAIKCTEIVEGDGGAGTIKKVHLGEGSEFSYVVHKIDGVDKDHFVYKYSIIEGDAIGDKIEKISYEIKLVACDGGCIIKSTSHYHCKGDFEIKEEHVNAGKDRAAGLFRLVEDYLVAHPEEYN